MAATFPGGIKAFSTKLDGGDILAAHINDLQNEVVAVESFILANDGWIPVRNSWSYLSGTQVTVPAGAVSIYSIGDRVRLTQTTAKYFVITSVSDTILGLSGGADYAVVNAPISSISYSIIDSPVGFPSAFNLATPTFTTSGTAFTNQPAKVSMTMGFVGNRRVNIKGEFVCNAVSGGTGRFIASFAAGQLPTFLYDGDGVVINENTWVMGFVYANHNVQNQLTIAKYDGNAVATNNEDFSFDVVVGF